MTSAIDTTHVRHGYTVRDLHHITLAALAADRLMAMDVHQRYDIAWSEIAMRLCTAEEPPHRQELVRVGWQAIYRHIRDGLRQRGYREREDGRNWNSTDPTSPRFVQYWAARAVPSHEDRVVEGIALAQVMETITGPYREAIIALAVHDDYVRAADSLGINGSAFRQRMTTARRSFLRRWHEGETPHRPRRTDRRVEVHGVEPATHCGKGHEWTPENTRVAQRLVGGRLRRTRECRACDRDRSVQRRREAHEAEEAAS